jgi:hypothetical protein
MIPGDHRLSERDTARLRACIEVFEEANQAYEGFSA